MKKKILFGLFVILAVVTLTGCGKKEDNNLKDITLKDEGYGTTVLKYNKDKDYTIKEETGGKYKELDIRSESDKIRIQLYHTDSYEESYNAGKNNRKESTGFKEYTWNGLNGYIYNADKNSVSFNILLKVNDKKAKVLFGEISTTNTSADALSIFTGDEFQKMMNSITFTE